MRPVMWQCVLGSCTLDGWLVDPGNSIAEHSRYNGEGTRVKEQRSMDGLGPGTCH